MATAPSPNDLTRQQLDELDALLQRMLSIPLNPSEPAPAPPPPPPAPPQVQSAPPPPKPAPSQNWRVDSPPPTAVPAPHVIPAPMAMPPVSDPVPPPRPPLRLEPERFVPPEPAARAMPTPKLPDPPPMPPMPDDIADTLPFEATSIPVRSPSPAPMPEPEPFAFPFQAPIPTQTVTPQETFVPPARPKRKRVSVIFWPFVAINYIIDGCLNLTGLPGRLITSWPVKSLLGLAGLGLIAYTGAYFAQQKGLVEFPQPLPWPEPLPWPMPWQK